MMSSSDKSKAQWFFEWVRSLLVLGGFVTIGIITYMFHINKNIFVFSVFLISAIGSAASVFIVMARTIGIIMMVLFPEKQAFDFSIDQEKIVFQLEKQPPVSYFLNEVNRIIIMETTNSIFINSVKSKDAYQLSMSLSYKQSEAKIDAINDPPIFKKERQFVETNAKDVDPNKSTEGVKRTTSRGLLHTYVYKINPEKAREVIYYTRI
ncbi:MAG: hypothetical protein HQL26_08820 [Candidatus Omnitrophica bacterium]|nr:hypothetical protein [Candidatus Omnitrophota bacterium]